MVPSRVSAIKSYGALYEGSTVKPQTVATTCGTQNETNRQQKEHDTKIHLAKKHSTFILKSVNVTVGNMIKDSYIW